MKCEKILNLAFQLHTDAMKEVIEKGEVPSKSRLVRELKREGLNYNLQDYIKAQKEQRQYKLAGYSPAVSSSVENFFNCLLRIGNSSFSFEMKKADVIRKLKELKGRTTATDEAIIFAMAGIFISSIYLEAVAKNELTSGAQNFKNIEVKPSGGGGDFRKIWVEDLKGAVTGGLSGATGGPAGAIGGAIIGAAMRSALALLDKVGGDTGGEGR